MSQKVKTLDKRIKFTCTWATDVLTITTASNHGLTTGDVVTVTINVIPHILRNVTVTVVDATHFTIPSTHYDATSGEVVIPFFTSEDNATRVVFTLPNNSGLPTILHTFVTGTGGATYNFDVSLDGSHWVNVASVVHPAVDGDSDFQTIGAAWAYGSISTIAIGASTKLTVMHSE